MAFPVFLTYFRDADTMSTLSILQGHHTTGVCALSFSASGKLLASLDVNEEAKYGCHFVCMQAKPDHTWPRLTVYRWKEGRKVAAEAASHHRLFQVAFRPDSEFEVSLNITSYLLVLRECLQFVTVGVKHIKFWTLAGGTLLCKRGQLPKERKLTTMLAVAFGPDQTTFSAAMNGEIWVWKQNQVHLGGVSLLRACAQVTVVAASQNL